MKKKIVHHIKKTHKKVQRRRKGRSNLNMFLTFAAYIMVLRGIWYLLDTYFIPQYYFLNAVIPLLLGIIYLLVDDRKLKELI